MLNIPLEVEDNTSSGLSSAEANLARFDGIVKQHANSIFIGVGTAITAGITGIVDKGAREIGSHIEDLNDQSRLERQGESLGVPDDVLDSWQRLFDNMELPTPNLIGIHQTLTNALLNPTGRAADAIKSLQIDLNEFSTLTFEERLKTLAEALLDEEGNFKQVDTAVSIFGANLDEVHPLLIKVLQGEEGQGGIIPLQDELDNLYEDNKTRWETWVDNWDTAMTRLKNEVLFGQVGVFTLLVNFLEEGGTLSQLFTRAGLDMAAYVVDNKLSLASLQVAAQAMRRDVQGKVNQTVVGINRMIRFANKLPWFNFGTIPLPFPEVYVGNNPGDTGDPESTQAFQPGAGFRELNRFGFFGGGNADQYAQIADQYRQTVISQGPLAGHEFLVTQARVVLELKGEDVVAAFVRRIINEGTYEGSVGNGAV